MSNILTAQERKRQIRERRRSLQSQTQAAASGVSSTNGNINDDRPLLNEDIDRASKVRKLDNLDKDEQNSFSFTNGSLSKTSTAFLSCESTRDATIQLESNMGEVADVTSNTAPRSLFSAVMKRSSATPDDSKNASSDTGNSLLEKVLHATNINESCDDTKQVNNVTFSASTPVKSPPRRAVFNKANSPGRSPGGFAIMKALDGVSDFNQTFYSMKDENEEDEGDTNSRQSQEEKFRVAKVITRTVPIHLTNDQEVQHEHTNSLDAIIEETKLANSTSMNASFYQEPIGIDIMDWSLKKRLRLMCSSGSLPGSSVSAFSRDRRKWPPPDSGYVQQLAVQCLANISTRSNSSQQNFGKEPSLEEAAIAKWTAATMYYQHPAVHPLPLSVLSENNGRNKSRDKNESINLSSFNNRSTYQRVRLSGIGSMGGIGSSDKLQKNSLETNASKSASSELMASFPTLLDKRICEWQESFKSFYQCWRSKMTMLGRFSTNTNNKPSSDEVSRCCFYSISPSQVILFRVGVTKENSVFPVIAFSSTTAELRSRVKSMGAELKVLLPNKPANGDANTEEKFTENMLENSQLTSRPESQGEAADLRALREANNSSTDNRPTEVEVTQKKKVQNDNKASSIPPLYVSGNDDCDIVYEILLNTCGLAVSGSCGKWLFQHDVPLLLCRSIGPCLNTVLKTLSVSARRDTVYWTQLNPQDQSNPKSESIMELYGPILPCSLRDLMCASINWMVLDQKLNEFSVFDAPTQPMNGQINVDSENKDTIQQISMYLQAHDGEFPVSLPTSTGSSSSVFFNHSTMEHKHENLKWNECAKGELLNSLVWNAHHASEVSYNTVYSS